jgi:hypothetical protein
MMVGIADLYILEDARVLDMTWGRGVFWRKVKPKGLVAIDAVTTPAEPVPFIRADFRCLPFRDASFDVVVLDPPYARHGTPMQTREAQSYQLNAERFAPTSAKEVKELYRWGIVEAWRLLPEGGILIVKCQDQIESGRQNWVHDYIMEQPGFYTEDLLVLTNPGSPAIRQAKQYHARKNHSYFLVLRKVVGR